MKFYSIKYVETRGIEEYEASLYVADRSNNEYASKNLPFRCERIGVTAFKTREEAVLAARKKLLDAIVSHEISATRKYNALKSRLRELGVEYGQ